MTRPAPVDRGLDALNLVAATMGTAYGAFIPVFLAGQAWTQTHIGLALTIATLVSTLCQVPAGLWVDHAGPKRRRALWASITIIGLTPLVLAALPRPLPVMLALALQSAAGTLLSPTIAAVSLAVAGSAGFGERLGRNARYGSIGAGVGAAVMGVSSTWLSHQAVFLIAAALLPAALLAITRIGPDRATPRHRHRHRHHPSQTSEEPPGWRAPFALLKDHRILIFAAALMLFQLASIAVLQLAAVAVTARMGARSGLVIAAFIIVPQAMVALAAPWIGAMAERHGRRPVLIAGFATTALRALGFMLISNPFTLIGVQILEGAGGAAFGVMMPLVAADLTRGTRRYTVCLGLLGLAATAGAALSTVLAGFVADRMGRPAAFLVLALAGLAATLLVAFALPETRPAGLAISPEPQDADANGPSKGPGAREG